MYLTLITVRDDFVDFQIETKLITLKGDKISLNAGQIISYVEMFESAIEALNKTSQRELNEVIELSDLFYCSIDKSREEIFISSIKLKNKIAEKVSHKIWRLEELRQMVLSSKSTFG